MAEKRATTRLDVDGMSCVSCEDRIEKAVRALDGVHDVAASASLCEVIVTYDPDRVGLAAVAEAIRGAGYQVRGDVSALTARESEQRSGADAVAVTRKRIVEAVSNAGSFYRFLGLVAVIAAIYLIIRYTVGLTFLPKVSQSMGYGLVFVVGLLTSLHCIAMCGGIVLSQGIAKQEGQPEPDRRSPAARLGARLRPSLLYNAGRVVSYTLIGGIVGALGTLFSLSTALKGFMPVLAGLFMLFLGVRMLGVIPWLSRLKIRFPGVASDKLAAAASRRGPFVVGLLNGLMPCGPLQTMQVYALGTGSFIAGATSLFLFSLGTVPLLLGFGAVSSFLSARFNRRMLKASGVLVMVLGFVMFTRGLTLFGVALPNVSPGTAAMAQITEGYQTVRTTAGSNQYQPFVVQSGIPVRWTISVKAEDLNGCNNPILIPQYGIKKQLLPGDNLVQFTPYKEGTFSYTCWMGMVSSTFRVVRDLTKVTASELAAPSPASPSATAPSAAASCCAAPEAFAGGKIPVDVIQVARPTSEGQVADITVNDNGYVPAAVVVKKGVKTKIRFIAEKLTACNSYVYFPDYKGGLDLSTGRLETPYLDVTGDFTFECGMGMLHGYVKAVDDPATADMQAIKREIAAYQPGSR